MVSSITFASASLGLLEIAVRLVCFSVFINTLYICYCLCLRLFLAEGKIWTGPMDLWTIGLFLDYFLDYILDYVLDYFFKPTFYQKVIFRVGILFIYGAEEGGNGNMKMPPKQ